MKSIFTILIILLSIQISQANIDSLKIKFEKAEGINRLETCNDIFIYYLEENNIDSIMKYYSLTIIESKMAQNNHYTARANYNMAINHNRMGLYQEAKEHNLQAIDYYLLSKDTIGYVKTLNNLALSLKSQNQYQEALQYLYKSLEIIANNTDSELYLKTHLNLGIVYYSMDNYDLALDFFYKSIHLANSNNFKEYSKPLLNNIASVHTMKCNYDSARYYYHKSKPIIKDEKHSSFSNYFNNLGYIDLKIRDYESALDNFEKALEIRRANSEYDKMVSSLIQIGKLYSEMGDKKRAIDHFMQADSITHKINNIEGIKDVSKYLSEIYYDLGKYKLASDFLKKYSTAKDSIVGNKYNSQIARMNTVYNLKTKNKENKYLKSQNIIQEIEIKRQSNITTFFQILSLIILIFIGYVGFNLRRNRKRNKILKEKNDKISQQYEELEKTKIVLQELNATKDKFFSIIAHDLINPFHVIISLTRILDADFDSFSNEEKKELINDLHNTSINTFSLLENLLNWSRSQRGQIKVNPQEFLVQDLVSDCIAVQTGNAKIKSIQLESFIQNELKLISDKDILQICLCNLISNSIKFTPQNGSIQITSKLEQQNVLISVQDSGIGMTNDKINKLFNINENSSTAGTENEKGTGLGLILVKELVEKNKGTIHVESEVGKGSNITISLPITVKALPPNPIG
ncbi:tetratricopeptide repeat-containing sensor histidine kinase [Ancylomarina sp. YFZ004]